MGSYMPRPDPMRRVVASCLFFFICLFVLVSLPLRDNETPDAITTRAVAQAELPELGFDEVERLSFKSFDGLLMTGNSRGPLWLKLQVEYRQEAMVLEVLPAFISDITVFQQTQRGDWQAEQGGLRHAFTARPMQTFNAAFPVRMSSPEQPALVYVRVDTPTAVLGVRAVPLSVILQQDVMLGGVIGLSLGLTLIMLMLCVIAWIVTGDRLWGYCVLLDLAALQLSAIQFGFVSRYLLPDAVDLVANIYPVSVSLVVLAACAFYGRLLTIFSLQGMWLLPYRAGLWMLPVWGFFWLAGRHDLHLLSNNLYLLVLAIWSIPVMVRVRHDNFWLLLLFRMLLLFANALILLWLSSLVLKIAPPPAMAFYAVLPHSLITLFVVLLLLGYNTLLQMRERIALEAKQAETSRRLAEEQERFAESTSFLSLILHEVRNPLNHIRLAVSNLLHELSDAGQQRRLRRISASVTVIDDVLQRSLDVDNIDHGILPIRKMPADVAGLVRQFVDEHPQSGRMECVLPGVLVAAVDADLLLMAMRNLIDNALKYSPPGSPIGLWLLPSDQSFSLRVRNQAGDAGLPNPERLFRKYYRADGAMTQSGMGLGLYWVSSVIPRLGGRIQYAEEQGEAVFTLWLPN